MHYDKRLAMVHHLAQGLLTQSMENGAVPLVIRAIDQHLVVGALRTVAAAADYSLRGYPDLPAADTASKLPPRHVVLRQGAITAEVAQQAIALKQAKSADTIVILLIALDDDYSMNVLGSALLANGIIEDIPDEELEPRQLVPAIRLG